jgi:hypothetical protein
MTEQSDAERMIKALSEWRNMTNEQRAEWFILHAEEIIEVLQTVRTQAERIAALESLNHTVQEMDDKQLRADLAAVRAELTKQLKIKVHFCDEVLVERDWWREQAHIHRRELAIAIGHEGARDLQIPDPSAEEIAKRVAAYRAQTGTGGKND